MWYDIPVICEKHWPTDYQTEKVCGGETRPVDPPSVFTGFAPSSIPTPLPKPRSTTTSFGIRTKKDDELEKFKEKDRITDFEALVDELKHNRWHEIAIRRKHCFIQSRWQSLDSISILHLWYPNLFNQSFKWFDFRSLLQWNPLHNLFTI